MTQPNNTMKVAGTTIVGLPVYTTFEKILPFAAAFQELKATAMQHFLLEVVEIRLEVRR